MKASALTPLLLTVSVALAHSEPQLSALALHPRSLGHPIGKTELLIRDELSKRQEQVETFGKLIPLLIPGMGNWFCVASELGGFAMNQLLHLLEGAYRTFQALLRSLTRGLQSLCTSALHFTLPDCGGVTSKGIEGGKPGKKMASVLSEDGLHTVIWDLSDESMHAEANVYNGRSIIHDDLRSDFMDSGIYNVTLIHSVLANESIPILAYQTGDGQFNYHWRPDAVSDSAAGKKKPHFQNNGAGFKMSSVAESTAKSDETFTKKQIKVIADTIVNDLLHKHPKATNVGYEQGGAKGKTPGHRLCFIAEKGRFKLNNEASKCFANDD